MEDIWQIRGFRLWLVLYVPAALFFGYQALSAAVEIAEARREVATWLKAEQAKVYRGERGPIELNDVRFAMLGNDFDGLYKRRNIALSFLAGGLAIPALAMLFAKVISWIWIKKPRPDELPRERPALESTALGRYVRWYGWSWAAVAVLGLLFMPEQTIQSVGSALIQGLTLVVVAWIIMRLKQWWDWRKK